jgi:hypothetical protein
MRDEVQENSFLRKPMENMKMGIFGDYYMLPTGEQGCDGKIVGKEMSWKEFQAKWSEDRYALNEVGAARFTHINREQKDEMGSHGISDRDFVVAHLLEVHRDIIGYDGECTAMCYRRAGQLMWADLLRNTTTPQGEAIGYGLELQAFMEKKCEV